jgi:hypothetical protein
MLVPFAAALAAPLPSPEGATLLDACLDAPRCAADWLPLFADTMLDAGVTLTHEPVITSAFGGKGAGAVAELEVGTAPLGPRNELQQMLPLVPALPSLAVGWHLGSYTYETPYPQFAVGVHGLPPIRVGDTRIATVGGSVSAAWPLGPVWWLGGEASLTSAWLDAPLASGLEALPALDGFLSVPECPEPCVERFRQHAPAVRAGVSFEPLPALFVWAKAGGRALLQRLDVAFDGSRWRWSPVFGELAAGAGIRAGDRLQLGLGDVASPGPHGWRHRAVATMGFRFGDARYHE